MDPRYPSLNDIVLAESISDGEGFYIDNDLVVARYLTEEFGAVLSMSAMNSPAEQTLEVFLRDAEGLSGELILSASSDWSPPADQSLRIWLSGFSVSGVLPSGVRFELVTGLLAHGCSLAELGQADSFTVRAQDSRNGAFVVPLSPAVGTGGL